MKRILKKYRNKLFNQGGREMNRIKKRWHKWFVIPLVVVLVA